MYKRNIYIEIINLLLTIIILLLLKNPIIQLLLLIYLYMIINNNSKKFFIISFIIFIYNILYGKYILLGNIILLLYYLYININKYSKKEIINNYICLFKKNPQRLWIKMLYYKEYFIKNYKRVTKARKIINKKNNINSLKKIIKKTNNDLDELIILYEKRLFYNSKKNIKKLKIDKNDIKSVIYKIILLVLVILFWREKYAIFI